MPGTSTRTPVFLTPATPVELLNHILSTHSYPTTLIITSTKESFLEALSSSLESSTKDLPHTPQGAPRPHPLLKQTISQISTSRHIQLLFAPTTSHLRALLGALPSSTSPRHPSSSLRAPPPPSPSDPPADPSPSLVIYGLVDSHRGTSEWSAQGIGATAAAAVDAAGEMNVRAVVVEPRREGTDCADEERMLAREGVPVLNRVGDDEWKGRTVEVGRIMKRWFTFKQERWTTD